MDSDQEDMEELKKHRFSTIRARLIGAFSLFAVLPLMAIPFYLYFSLMQKVGVIEVSELRQGEQQLEQTLKTYEVTQLQNTQDYAHWDDAVTAVKGHDEAWIKSQIFDYVTKHYGYEFVIVADLSGNVLWSVNAPDALSHSVVSLPVFLAARSGDEHIGYVGTSDDIDSLSAANIIPLASEGTAHAAADAVGVLLYGNRLDNSLATDISNAIARNIAFFDTARLFASSGAREGSLIGTAFANIDVQALKEVLSGRTYVSDSPGFLYLYRPVVSGDNHVVGAIRIGQSRATTNFVRSEMSRNVAVLFCISLLLLILLGLLIEIWIVRPVLLFTQAIHKYRAHERWKMKTLSHRNDEVGDLYRSFEMLIGEIERSEREILSRDKQLGLTNRKLAQNAEEISRAKQLLESKLQEISKLNTFMIGREVRMAELKEELKKYKH